MSVVPVYCSVCGEDVSPGCKCVTPPPWPPECECGGPLYETSKGETVRMHTLACPKLVARSTTG